MLMRAQAVRLGEPLTVEDLVRVARYGAPVELSPASREAIERSAAALARHVASGARVYGATTGVGALETERVGRDRGAIHQRRLLASHAAGVGPLLDEEAARATMLARLASLARGASGIRPTTVQALIAMLNAGVTPAIPSIGSVGASDLAALAHMALPLLGLGRAWVRHRLVRGAEAMAQAGIPLPELGGRDGLALMNGLGLTNGVAAIAAWDARRLVRTAEVAGALGLAALGGVPTFLHPRSVGARAHPGAASSAARLRKLLDVEGTLEEPLSGPMREHLSTRTLHHVAGAAGDAIDHLIEVLERELWAASDNPMVEADGWVTNNAANFDGHFVCQSLDTANQALVALAASSERRTARLLDPTHNGGLPAFLSAPDEHDAASGLMIAQYTAAALVAELRTSATPVTGQTMPTCNGTEDVVSMAPIAARRLRTTVGEVADVIAVEIVTAAQASHLSERPLSPALRRAYALIRDRFAPVGADDVIADHLAEARSLVLAGDLATL